MPASCTPAPLGSPAETSRATTASRRLPGSTRTLALLGGALAAALVTGTVVAMPAEAAAATTITMSTSATPVTDSRGGTWAARYGFTGGRLITPPPAGTVIKGTADQQLYLSSMFLMTGWSAPVTDGSYVVTLKMVDTWYGTAKNRVFSVTAEGAPALTGVDIAGAVGQYAAYDRSFPVTVTDGQLDLGFAASKSSATVSAISVVPAATPAPTTPAPTTPAPSTPAPAPTTPAPTTPAPTTSAPTTSAPTTSAPTTSAPTTSAPTTSAPTTPAPTTPAPTTSAPTAAAPGGWLSYGDLTSDSPTTPPTTTTPDPPTTTTAPAPPTTTPAPPTTTPAPPTTTPAPPTTTPTPPTTTPTPPTSTPPSSGSRPGADNTGVPAGTVLTRRDGFTILNVAGATYQNLDIHGRVRIMAPNITLKNSIIRGDNSQTLGSIVDVNNPGANHDGFRLVDSEIVPEFPQWQQDGILGHDYTVIRSNIHGTTDAVKVAGDNVTVVNSWLHDTKYFTIPGVGYGDTHNDGVQSAGGNNLTIVGNTIEENKNSAIMLAQDRGPITNVTIADNYLDDGACSVNNSTKSYATMGPITVRDNTFGHGQTNVGCAVIANATKTTMVFGGNVWDSGAPVKMSRGT